MGAGHPQLASAKIHTGGQLGLQGMGHAAEFELAQLRDGLYRHGVLLSVVARSADVFMILGKLSLQLELFG